MELHKNTRRRDDMHKKDQAMEERKSDIKKKKDDTLKPFDEIHTYAYLRNDVSKNRLPVITTNRIFSALKFFLGCI